MSHTFTDTSTVMGEHPNGVEWSIRPYREGDIGAIAALINSARRVDTPGEPMGEDELRRAFEAPRFEPARQVIVVEGPRLEGMPPGELLGYGRVAWYEDEGANERIYTPRLTVHPGARGRGLEHVIVGRLFGIARGNEARDDIKRMGKATVDAGTREEVFYLCALWESIGLKQVRQYWTMARSLDEPIDEPQPIEGVRIRPYEFPADNLRTLEAYNNSFADHFDYHPESEGEWSHWVSGPFFRGDLSWLAEIEEEQGKIAGFCLCTVFEEENEMSGRQEGWIDILGTVRGWRRMGLGRALLLNGLHSLRSAGLDTALLGVDSQSPTGANRLYESVGFRIRSREVQFKGLLDEVRV
jgi:mycothiol synthase